MLDIVKVNSIDDHVSELIINRPDQYNTFNTELRLKLLKAIDAVNGLEKKRVIILKGEGPGFCAGADLNDGGQMPPSKQLNEEYFPIFEAISKSKKLFIAAVHGSAAGIGTALAMNCDFIAMASSSRISMVFSNIGLVPDGGATYLLQKSIGYRKALEVIVSGSHLQADECKKIGLANKIFNDKNFFDEVNNWAVFLSQRSPLAASAAKTIMRKESLDQYVNSFEMEATAQDKLAVSNDFRNAVESFFKKEKPSFKGN
jgi:2-(1,2-epoxy-1,2-dihydrophenyl)acetyl-CoA isomerase